MSWTKKLFSRANRDGKKSKAAEKAQLEKLDMAFNEQAEVLRSRLLEKLAVLLKDKTTAGIRDYFGVEIVAKGTRFTQKMLGGDRLPERSGGQMDGRRPFGFAGGKDDQQLYHQIQRG